MPDRLPNIRFGKGSCNFAAIACKRPTRPCRRRSSSNSGRWKPCGESEQRYRELIELAPDAIVTLDWRGRRFFHQRSVLRHQRLHSGRSRRQAVLETGRFPRAGHPQVPPPLRLAAPRQTDGPHRIGLLVEGWHGGGDRVPGIGHAKRRQGGGAAAHLPQRHRTEEGRAGPPRERADAAGHPGIDRRRHPGRHGRRQNQAFQRALSCGCGAFPPN